MPLVLCGFCGVRIAQVSAVADATSTWDPAGPIGTQTSDFPPVFRLALARAFDTSIVAADSVLFTDQSACARNPPPSATLRRLIGAAKARADGPGPSTTSSSGDNSGVKVLRLTWVGGDDESCHCHGTIYPSGPVINKRVEDVLDLCASGGGGDELRGCILSVGNVPNGVLHCYGKNPACADKVVVAEGGLQPLVHLRECRDAVPCRDVT